MKRVEMLGAMGAGKSTIYEALIQSDEWKRAKGFETAVSEKEKIFLREARQQSVAHWIFLKLLLRVPRMRDLLVTKNITQSAWESLRDQQEAFRGIMELILSKEVADESHLPLSLLRTRQSIDEVVNVAHLLACGECKVVLHDESLLTRGLGAAADAENGEELIEAWCRAVPMPDLIILVNTPLDTMKERIRKRNNHAAAMHEKQVEKIATLIERVKRGATERDVQIVEVDGMEEPRTNAAKCFAAIGELLGRGGV